MAGLDGLEVQTILNELSPRSRVIIITARNDNSLHSAAMKGGATDFFLKPFDKDQLLRAVHNALDA